jgi:hypothetical protein
VKSQQPVRGLLANNAKNGADKGGAPASSVNNQGDDIASLLMIMIIINDIDSSGWREGNRPFTAITFKFSDDHHHAYLSLSWRKTRNVKHHISVRISPCPVPECQRCF